ncbi:tRNA(Ile)-lysidine synthase [Peptoniphilus asaccharolyticus DSM 20463]|uniref:tRNA(Ile)-lysidine synthase n=2 Tax=Peptoniphilus asaccharolyticus TaxID=1258 RepID=A0A1W1UKA9_PEPAS|nr:tRNA(Ile)-lysidine synthase [Peptoniphilus asaccharolyticus DSM 20463]
MPKWEQVDLVDNGHQRWPYFFDMKYNRAFYENLKKYNMVDEGEEIVVGCSGGADSMFLLYNLFLLKEELKLKIKVCHVNHGIRETAKRDQEFVKKIAEELNLEFYTINVNMDDFAKENKMSSEEAGRFLRYKFFRQFNSKIFTAHNKDDQAETILYRIIRGTGLAGLQSIEYVNGDLYRPMLNISRKEIEAYLLENNIEHIEDETNSMTIYTRNKLRLELIPYIEENLNSNFKDALLRLQDLSQKQNSYFQKIIDLYFEENLDGDVLNIANLKDEDDYLISLIVREYFIRLDLIEGIGKAQIENIVELVKQDSATITVHKSIFEISQGYLFQRREAVEIDDILKIGENKTELGTFVVESGIKKGKNSIQIDATKIKGQLKVRNKRNGDKFTPIGMKGSKKLKDFFIDERIPKYKRDSVALIVDDEEIIWVAPYRMNEKYKIEKETEKIVSISLEV